MSTSAKRFSVPVPVNGYYPALDGRRVEIQPNPSEYQPKRYAVYLDDEMIGHVYPVATSWERRSPGARYVTARGEYKRPEWGHTMSRRLYSKGRNSAAWDLADKHVRGDS